MMDFDNLTPKQRIDRFDGEHGASEYESGWYYYADGARREGNPLGALCPPSAQPRDRHAARVYYHRLRTARAVREFDELKEQMTQGTGWCPDHEENVRKLKELQGVVRHCQRQLVEAEEDLRYATTGRTLEEERALQQMEAEMKERRQQQRKELEAIEV